MKYSAAVIGLGIGERHARTLSNHQDIQNVFVYDIIPISYSKLSDCKEIIPCRDIAEIYNNEEILLVVIATYDNTHFEIAKECIIRGKSIFFEKPIVLKQGELKILRQLLDGNPNISFSCNFVLRNSPVFLKIKSLLQLGMFGNVYLVEGHYQYGRKEKILEGWRGKIDNYSINMGGGIHIFDLFYWLFDRDFDVSLLHTLHSSVASNEQIRNDFYSGTFVNSKGCLFRVSSHAAGNKPHCHEIRIYGSRMSFEMSHKSIRLFNHTNKNGDAITLDWRLNTVYDKSVVLRDFIDRCSKDKVVRDYDILVSHELALKLENTLQ